MRRPSCERSAWARWLTAGCALIAGCGGCPGSMPPPAVEVAGCAAWRAVGTCVAAADTRLVLWFPGEADELRLEGAVVTATAAVEEGTQVILQSPAPPAVLHLSGAGSEGRWRWPLTLEAPPRSEAVEAAVAARTAGDVAGAEAALARVPADAPPMIRVAVEVERARLAAARGDGGAAEAARLAAVAIARAGGLASEVRDQSLSLAHVRLFLLRNVAGARAAIEAAAAVDAPAGQAVVAYMVGVLDQQVGNTRGALAALTEANQWSRRLGQSNVQRLARSAGAVQLAQAGRLKGAWQMAVAPESAPGPCERAADLENRGWIALLFREAGWPPPQGSDPRRDLEAALGIYRADCFEPAWMANVWVNLALAALHSDDVAEARHALAKAAEFQSFARPFLAVWVLDLEGRLALKARRLDSARRAFDQLSLLAERAVSPDAAWRATVGLARVAGIEGRLDEATTHFSRAEDLLDRLVWAVGVTQGRDALLAARQPALEDHLALLLDAGHADEAMQVALRDHVRAVRGLHRENLVASLSGPERARWEDRVMRYQALRGELDAQVSATWRTTGEGAAEARRKQERLRKAVEGALDEALGALPPLVERPVPDPPDTLTLLYAPLGRGWVGFAKVEGAVRAARVTDMPADDDAALAAALLAPFEPELVRAAKVRILAPAALASLDFHASPLGGAPLAASRAVVYGLGVPGPQAEAEGPALVVADPQGNLPEARAEARAVLAELPGARLLQGFEATGAALRAGLAYASLLHYAGHGREHGGWGSELPLADGAALRVGDILALPRVPARVVLSGCETGAAAGEHGVGLGLAQAFILAGAQGVVAATRPVPDAAARALMEVLYTEDPRDLVVALHRAQARLRARDPEVDWAAFRIFVP